MSGSPLPRLLACAVLHAADWLLSPRKAVAVAEQRPLPDEASLWRKTTTDDTGPVTIGLWPLPCGRLGVLVTADGHVTGLRLNRAETQELRHAVTGWLVGTAQAVTR